MSIDFWLACSTPKNESLAAQVMKSSSSALIRRMDMTRKPYAYRQWWLVLWINEYYCNIDVMMFIVNDH